jgi:tRNA(Ile)-lysidine synthase
MLRAMVRQFFVKRGIPPCRLAVAASGGVDSTALLLAVADLRADGFAVLAAHVNHRLRGAESDADESFVRDICVRVGIELVVFDGTLDPELVRARGVEAAAREVRYERLRNLDARYVATAHQKNDQAETVLMRLLTGSGIAGLRGIHPLREDGFVRPLLDVTRAEIEEFLQHQRVVQGVVARVDRSNEDPRFLRNRVRAFLRETGGHADFIGALAHVAEQARAQWPILERAIDDAEHAHAEVRDHETRFTSWPPYQSHEDWLRGALLLRHIRRLDPHARDFDASRIASEVDAIKRMSVTKNLELVRIGGALVLRKPPEAVEAFEVELTEEHPAHIATLRKTMHLARLECGGNATALESGGAASALQTIQLPEGATPTFLVRNRCHGDRFHPLGLPQPKKLKDFLIDRKIAAELRDRLPLLVWNGEIVWIAGVEVSERFKVTDPPGVLYRVWLDDDRDDQSRLQR